PCMHEIDPPEPERDGFAHVSDNDLEVWKPVEHAADDQPHDVSAGLDAVTPHCALDSVTSKRTRHPVRRSSRMNVERPLQMLGSLENRPEFGIIEVLAVRVRVHDKSLELQPVDGTIHFLCRSFGRMRGKACKARKA